MRIACYRAVLPKIDRRRLIEEEKGKEEEEEKKKKEEEKKEYCAVLARALSLPAGRSRAVAAFRLRTRGERSRRRTIPIVNDLKFTVTHAVEPMEKGLTRFNQKLHKISQNIRKHDKKLRTKDDSCIGSSSPTRRVHGIDDSLLDGSISDSGSKRGRRHCWKSGYTSAESGGESSDHGHGRYEIHGHRWITRD
ncbi:hypothetical protein GW17_00026663 [Ensete ventricosum]|nr:hypothetical protein GW17_00026663 [Ensete ventricosum]